MKKIVSFLIAFALVAAIPLSASAKSKNTCTCEITSATIGASNGVDSSEIISFNTDDSSQTFPADWTAFYLKEFTGVYDSPEGDIHTFYVSYSYEDNNLYTVLGRELETTETNVTSFDVDLEGKDELYLKIGFMVSGNTSSSVKYIHLTRAEDNSGPIAGSGDREALLTNLQSLITKAGTLNAADYTAASWATLQSALSAAKEISVSENATEVQLKDAATALSAAFDALVAAETPKTPDGTGTGTTGTGTAGPAATGDAGVWGISFLLLAAGILLAITKKGLRSRN